LPGHHFSLSTPFLLPVSYSLSLRDALPISKFFACLVRFESSSVPTTLPTAYDVYPLDGRHDGGYYTVKDCVTIDVLPKDKHHRQIGRAVQQECRDRTGMPSSAWKRKSDPDG